MGRMNKFTLLRAVIGISSSKIYPIKKEVRKYCNPLISNRICFCLFSSSGRNVGLMDCTGAICGRFCDTFVLGNTYKGSVLPVFQVRVRAKVRAKLASMAFIRRSLVFRSSS